MNDMPALFIGHGSPMNALERNDFTDGWRRLGEQLPRPSAVLVISAHWYIGATAVTAMAHPRTIHDFYGFPPELFAFQYPAPGAPDVASAVAQVLKPTSAGLDHEWGLDHGAWSVLAHVFPDADVPVVQLSINALEPLGYHLELGARLASLRREGVLIIGSGNVVHNLRLIQWNNRDGGEDWARRFDEAVAEVASTDPAKIVDVQNRPEYALAVPTPDHFIPLLYISGLAAAEARPLEPMLRGYSMGSLSMTCYGLGVSAQSAQGAVGAASLPEDVSPDQTNT